MDDIIEAHDERLDAARNPIAPDRVTTRLEEMKSDIIARIQRNAPIIGVRNPMIGAGPNDFTWLYPKSGYFWTDSFWTGQLWLAHMITGDPALKNMARMRIPHFKRILDTPLWLSHDLGFLFSLSMVADYKLTGDGHAHELALRAAEALRGRFNWAGNYLVAWTAGAKNREHARKVQGKIIIDCMQNLALLLWAFNETNVAAYRDAAIGQADTTIKHLIRADFSTHHTFDFDTTTSEPIGASTWQGYSDESCWSRGQAWAIHGFAQVAEITGEMRYAEIAARLADYAIDKLTDDWVPVWDYLLPEGEPAYKDTSAGAVTSAGLLLLAEVLARAGQTEQAARYREFGLKMLFALRENHDLRAVEHAQGLLSNAASHVRLAGQRSEPNMANAMLPYGDYYYFEAVLRGLGHREFFWY
ncbi:hypothetical protein [Consotaella aegiceratis]|uniref:hypothetical protein n=1 Tax=Consotaella aegiceratis TaxID=3097961 RepID=UPI002F40893E